MVSQRQRSKLKVESTIHAMRLALEYMQKVNIKPEELRNGSVFSTVPYQKPGSRELIHAAKHGKVEDLLDLLKQNRFLIFDFDNIFMTGLHWAAKRDHPKIVQVLIDYGADVDARDIIGRTPLYFAI